HRLADDCPCLSDGEGHLRPLPAATALLRAPSLPRSRWPFQLEPARAAVAASRSSLDSRAKDDTGEEDRPVGPRAQRVPRRDPRLVAEVAVDDEEDLGRFLRPALIDGHRLALLEALRLAANRGHRRLVAPTALDDVAGDLGQLAVGVGPVLRRQLELRRLNRT